MRGMMESTGRRDKTFLGENMFRTAADDCLMKDPTLECSYISCHFINRIFPGHNSWEQNGRVNDVIAHRKFPEQDNVRTNTESVQCLI